jgi:hypothetical protein
VEIKSKTYSYLEINFLKLKNNIMLEKRIILLIVLLALVLLFVFASGRFYLKQQEKVGKLDEKLCASLLSKYEPKIMELKYEEVYSNRYLNFSTGDSTAKWKINYSGDVLIKRDFLPNIPIYQFRVFFVWTGNEFEGCGIHYTFFNQTKRIFKNHLKCSGGGIEGAPQEVYLEYDNTKDYYLIAYELIHKFDSSIKSTYHITFSNNPSDLNNGLNLINMYRCK